MNKIYKKHLTTIGLIWAGCFVLLLFAYMVILVPQKKSKSQTEKELAEKKQAYHAAVKKAEEETQAQLRAQIEELRNSLNGFVVGPEGSANLILDIGRLAGNKKLGSFKIGGQDKRRTGLDLANCNYIGEDHIDISFTAGFNQFATFLNALERHEPVVFVDDLLITRSDKGTSGHQIDMSLSVFVRKQQES
jgi:Tfp pilus assembly protein PilO